VKSMYRPLESGGREHIRSESSAEWSQVKPDMSVEDRYYNKQEYGKLTSAQKKGLGAKRKTRGHWGGDKSSNKRQRTGSSSVNMTQKQFQQKLVKAVATIKKMQIVPEESSDSDDSVRMKKGNRDNKALQHKKN
jgi:hypothetical protein